MEPAPRAWTIEGTLDTVEPPRDDLTRTVRVEVKDGDGKMHPLFIYDNSGLIRTLQLRGMPCAFSHLYGSTIHEELARMATLLRGSRVRVSGVYHIIRSIQKV